MAFGLGLLEEKEYKDIERINQVRNYFAHVAGRQLGFADDRPTELCVNLEVLAQRAVDPEEDRPRSRYLRAVQHISIHFETRVLIAGRRQLVG